jgi:parallel beta-helix repeat protein
MKKSFVAIIVVYCFLLPSTLPAADYYVAVNNPAGCDDGWIGTEDQPWCTIQKAAGTLVAGDTVYVKEGIYREAVVPANAGTSDSMIQYIAYEGDSVVVTGADEITGWQPCTEAECPDNAHVENIFYAEIDWVASQLFEQNVAMPRAREPDDDWWVAEGGGTTTLIDTQHLCADCLPGITQRDDFWNGGTLALWDRDMSVIPERIIVGFDIASSTLTLDEVIYQERVVEPGVDLYYLENSLALIDERGEWVMDEASSPYRVYLWPAGAADPGDLLIEGSRRSRFVIEYGTRSYLRFEGFEICCGSGHGIGTWSDPYPEGVQIAGNRVHHNKGAGIYLRETRNSQVTGNIVYANETGISGGPNCTLEGNEIRDNGIDGLWPGSGAVIRGNIIKNHNIKDHPDNIQTCCSDSFNIVFEGNMIINAGQCFMLEQTYDGIVRNNIILGSGAYCLIFGHETVDRWQVTGNTFGLTGYGSIRMTGEDYTIRNNIFFPAGTSNAFAAPQEQFESDYNLFYNPDTDERGVVGYGDTNYGAALEHTFAEYQAASGYDQHSAEADPRFLNFPACMAQSTLVELSTTSEVYLMDNEDCFAPADHIEIDFDGVVRTVGSIVFDEAQDHHALVFDPPLDRKIWHGFLILNWKEKTDYAIDVTPAADSPACHMSDRGSYVGAVPCVGMDADTDAGAGEGGEGGAGCGCLIAL